MKYVIFRNGNRIGVKRSDRNNDFGEVIAERDTREDAERCAKAERLLRKHIEQGHGLFSNARLDRQEEAR